MKKWILVLIAIGVAYVLLTVFLQSTVVNFQ